MPYTRYNMSGLETVKFDGKDSYAIYGMILTKKEIGIPQRKITKVTSPLMDGDVDVTDIISSPKYSNRKLKFYFSVEEDASEFDSIYRKICQEINGVYFDNGIEVGGRQYSGRASVNKWSTSKTSRTLTIEVDAKPYCFDIGSNVKRYE